MKRRVIVIGAGAAGLMAAGQAAEAGAAVLLLEKMPRPARKLRISGKGRGNLTNLAPLPEFIEHIHNGRFLRQAFGQFFAPELLAFFESLGVSTVAERGGRVFVASGQAQDVVDALVNWVVARGVEIRTGAAVQRILIEQGRVVGVQEDAGPRHLAEAVILATGGASYPATGSTGDGYRMAEQIGHTIVPIRPALVPLETAGDVAGRLEGLTLKNVRLAVWTAEQKQAEAFGEMLFTSFGVAGPIVLTLSRQVVDLLRAGQKVMLSINLKPALDEQTLDARLRHDLDKFGRKSFQNWLKGLLPIKLIPVCIDQVDIPPYRVAHQINAQARKRLRAWLQDFRLPVTGHRPWEEALVTAGGVDTSEIFPKTMASRLIDGLYLAGEVIDIDADTGGYNLQAAFSTGWVAGRAAAQGMR